jgi:TonB family protein
MNRLQKKCLIATTGFHLLLILVLVFGSAFFVTHPKQDESQVLDVIPANLVDAAFSSGVKNAQAPAPTPPQHPQPPQPPEPVQPTPPPQPQPKPEPTPEPAKTQKLSPDDLKPVETTQKAKEHKIEVNKAVVTRTSKPVHPSTDPAKTEVKPAKQTANAVNKVLASLDKTLSSSTVVDMPGSGSVAYASYKDALASIYYDAWTPPDDTSNDDAVTKVRITIARDGTVVSARIIGPSGDARVDASVQRAIDRVSSLPPLPEGTKENERTVILNFNLKTKRQIG